jgi:hypothetical protein
MASPLMILKQAFRGKDILQFPRGAISNLTHKMSFPVMQLKILIIFIVDVFKVCAVHIADLAFLV